MTTKWKRINSYIQEQATTVYTNDTGYTLGKVNGEWVMEDFDGKVVERAETLTKLKAKYQQWYC